MKRVNYPLLFFRKEKKMSKVSAKDLVKGIKSTLSKRSPEILTGIGIAGMITTTIPAVKAIFLLQ